MNENITGYEIFNDGKTIHLYYNDNIGLYVAYGISAFLLCKYTKAQPSYSDEMQMPVVEISAEHLELLSKQPGLLKNMKDHRCLVVEVKADEDDYSDWAFQLRMGAELK